MKNVLELLERCAAVSPDKTAFTDETHAVAYADLLLRCQEVGTALHLRGLYRQIVAVYMPQSVDSLVSAFGIVYAGCAYVILDSKMPPERIRSILETVRPAAVLCDGTCAEQLPLTGFSGMTLRIDELAVPVREDALAAIRARQIDADPVYILFTSGSTGTPKGSVLTHRNVLSYSRWFSDTFLTPDSVLGNQTPFYFSMSVSDVYGTLQVGATLHILPKKLFSFPVKLLEYLNEKAINTIYWVPSALCIVADWKALDYVPPKHLHHVLFAGEVMPARQLNYWRRFLPDAVLANLFGPTETTDICCFYVVDRPLSDSDSVPIGSACNNCECIVLGADGKAAAAGEVGELYVRGSFVSPGYFGDPEKTAKAFVQNPLQNDYPEWVYRTGDLVRVNAYGEMEYVSRTDHQIKHMGYRIELGEIEAAAGAIETIRQSVAVYDKASDEIVLLYSGKKTDPAVLLNALSRRLPNYMLPSGILRVREMPLNANGKIDRAYLQSHYKDLETGAKT